jgi:hypothetical protein
MLSLLTLIALLLLLAACKRDTAKPDAEATVQAAVVATQTAVRPTEISTPVPPTPTPAPPTSTPTRTPIPTPTPTPTPAVAAVVTAEEGADLRIGTTTWWGSRRNLPAGTELELVGYDPDFPDWVYVRAVVKAGEGEREEAGPVEGWTQIEGLEINRDLETLPLVTPAPTLTPTVGTPEPTPFPSPEGCAGGPLTAEAWHIDRYCVPGAWTAVVYVGGYGGNCVYTYAWEGEIVGGPMTGGLTFELTSIGTIVGTASVTSAGETVGVEVYIQPPSCN